MKIFKFIAKIPMFIALGFVYFYKYAISPILPKTCHFTPSCSTYAVTALKRFGLFYGGWLAAKRIVRCNPKTSFKKDPVPYNLKGDFKWLI